jgi:hypothetical protein
MAINQGMGEVMEACRKTKNVTQKVQVLQGVEQDLLPHLKDVLQLTYSPRITWLLPPGAPPYRPLEEDLDVEGQFISEIKNFRYFINVDGKPLEPDARHDRREVLFIRILEMVSPIDAELLIQMKGREIKGVSKEVAKQAFPDLGV